MLTRSPQQVAKRALILAALAFRGSLEVTQKPRAADLAGQLLPWLAALGCDDGLDPIEREELGTPLGQLSSSQQVDLNTADYAAGFFAWALGRLPLPTGESRPDQRALHQALPVLREEARKLLRQPLLRDARELEDAAREYLLLRSALQQARTPAASEVLSRIALQQLAAVGISADQASFANAAQIVGRLSEAERRRRSGLIFVLEYAALWLFSTRPSYFSE